jgi:tight adherence protein B
MLDYLASESFTVVLLLAAALLASLVAAAWYFSVISASYKKKVVGRLNFELPKLFLFTRADKLLGANGLVALLLVVLIWWLTESLVPTILVAMGCGLLPSLTLRWLKNKRQKAMAAQFPEFASLLASSLRSGSGLALALNSIAGELPEPLNQEISLLLRESLASFSLRTQIEDFSLMCAAIRISRSSGGNLADTLDSLSSSSRRKLALEGKIQSLTAQGKLQGWVMAALPLVLALALFQIEPRAMRPLISTWYGWAVVAVVVVLQLVGLHFIRRIVRVDI